MRRGDDIGMAGEAEIVVGAEDQHLAAILQRHHRSLRRGQHALILPETGVADARQLAFEVILERVHQALPPASSPHGTRTTLPALPLLRSAIAAWNCSIGMTCVIAGRMSRRPEPSKLSIWTQVSNMRRP